MKYIPVSFFLLFAYFNSYSTSYFISPGNGNDQNSGQLSQPFKTINKAIELIKPGDKIFLMAGNYYETIFLSRKKNITITAHGDGDAILYGVHEEFIDNQTYTWKLIKKEKNKHFKNEQFIYVVPLPKKKKRQKLPDYYDQFNYIFDKDGKQLYGYRKREDFNHRSKRNTEGEGYWFGKDSVYVAVNDPYSDRYNSLYISKTGSLIRNLGCNKLVIDGGQKKQIILKYSGRYAYSAEGNIEGSTIKNVKFEDCNTGVYLFGISGSEFQIDHCKFSFETDPKLIWRDIKQSFLESTAIAYAKGTLENLLIHDSHFEGVFNGISSNPGNTKIERNIFIDIGDDAVELEGDAVNIIVKGNYFIDCFTAFALCPVEKGPVFIYNNTVYNSKSEFAYSILKNGALRNVPPKTLKFWNLPNGQVLKDGQKQKVSGNVHFYYNTIIAKVQPFSIGLYNKKFMSPVNSSFYNNIFYSQGTLTNSTGFSDDGIDIDNNLFYSSFKVKKEPRLFIGWDGSNHSKSLKNNNKWSDNIFQKIEFEEFKSLNSMPENSPFKLCKKDKKGLLKTYYPKTLPDHFPGAEVLNNRQLPGAKQ